jgi:hypothetical protein
VNCRVFDASGRQVATLREWRRTGQALNAFWDGAGCAAGVYFVAAVVEGRMAGAKAVLPGTGE